MLEENNKMATELVADYLRVLCTYSLEEIKNSPRDSVVDALRFHVVITIPAIWKEYTRQGMEEAAMKSSILARRPAGETTLSFAPEPDAAALSTLSEPSRKTKHGHVDIICDAGGGTVVLIYSLSLCTRHV
jgi:molecular chaperone DnaK (HSP70)